MRPVVKYTLKQTVFLNIVFVILVVAGVFSVLTTPVENMPNVDIGKVLIQTVYYGASADDVEQLVTTKIEDAIESLEQVEFIQSHSYRNFSSVTVKFIDDADYESLYDDLRFRVLNIKNDLPEGVDEPTFIYIDTNIWLPVIIVNISGDLPFRALERLADDLKVQLVDIANVRDVDIQGDYDDEFHVSLDPAKLRHHGITFFQVAEAVRSANTKIPTGRFRQDRLSFMLDAGEHFKSQSQVLDTVVRRDGDGNFVRLGDLVTTARISHRDPRVVPSVNGADTIRLVVTKETLGNAVTISDQVKEVAARFGRQHRAEGINIVFTNDSVIEISDSVNTLGGNLILGMTLVTLVLWLTLGFRNAMLTAIGIPFSFLCAIIIMKLSGVSLNTISLFAFVLVTGILVDDAVVIVENTYRHIQMGKTKRQAIIDGTSEVILPVISSALTTALAFLPMLIMTGSTGEFFAVIPKTVTYALAASLLEALFVLPVHVFDWGPSAEAVNGDTRASDDNGPDPFAHLQQGPFAVLWRLYRRVVLLLLDHKITTFICLSLGFVAALAILILSMTGIVPLIKVKFFPGNYFRYHVTLQTAATTAIERTDAMVRDLSRFIMSLGPAQAQSASGDAGYFEDPDYIRHMGQNYGQIVVTLPDEKRRDFPQNPTNDPMLHLDYIRRRINDFVARTYRDDPARPMVNVFEESDGPPTGKPVNIRISALSIEAAIQASDVIMGFLRSNPELADLVDIADDRPDLYKTVRYLPRQEALFEYGLTNEQVTAIVAGALNGIYAGPFQTVDKEIDLLVRVGRVDDPGNTSTAGLAGPVDVLDIPVIESSVAPIYLRDLVDLSYGLEPNVRTRYRSEPTITLAADIRPGSPLSPARVQVLVNQFFQSRAHDHPGTSISFGGEFESTSKSYTSLTFAFFIAILGIYLVLASQFRDYFQPMIILTAVPFAVMGVAYGLFVSRTTFTVGSFLAMVGLSGVAVNNTLLLIDFMNKRLRSGKPVRQAILEACATRMRPVMITTVTTMLGLLPMAIGIPHKSISWAPMATTFVSGLVSSTTLALLITPANYELLEQMRARLRRRKIKDVQPTSAVPRDGGKS